MTRLSKAIRLMVWMGSSLSMVVLLTPVAANDGIAGVLEHQTHYRGSSGPSNNSSLLRAYTQKITVKIYTGDQWSSGTLIQRHGKAYTVLTNQHVLRTGTSYQVQTFDGRLYRATARSERQFADTDLALLHFRTARRYAIATLGSSLSLPVGSPVFAAGFPITESESPVFQFTTGEVSQVAPQVLEGGYQLGYTNQIQKGMSGGPVLNARGEVIAINGVHQEPLWGDHSFADGSKPRNTLQPTFANSSWAIPIETFIKLSTR